MTRLVRFSPTSEMRSLQREIDRLFDNFTPARKREEGGSEPAPAQQANWTPRVDLAETEDEYSIRLDVPGVAKEDIEINFQDSTLSISGERVTSSKEEESDFVRVERSAGRFFRSFSLPKTIKENEITAEYDNGVLTIHVPKAGEKKPRRIEVN